MTRPVYTAEAAERDAHVIDLIDARARYARALALQPAMGDAPRWAAMMTAAGVNLRLAARACAGCEDRLAELALATEAAEQAALR